MLGSNVLEVAIGLIFLFFILSLIASAAREVLEGLLQSRAADLERGIRELLLEPPGKAGTLTANLYNHPLVNGLFRGTYAEGSTLAGRNWLGRLFRRASTLPAYIPARNFALAMLDLSARGAVTTTGAGGPDGAPITLERIRAGVSNLANPEVERAVLIALDQAKGDLEQARLNLQAWYDSAMDRVSGWYRKQTQWILFWIGLFLAAAMNIDTIGIAGELYRSDALRSLIVAEAQAVVDSAEGEQPTDAAALQKLLGCSETATAAALAEGKSCLQKRLDTLDYPIGWPGRVIWPGDAPPDRDQKGTEVLWWLGTFPWHAIPGWILTALAITLGAPFWFDLLNKIMVIRSTVKPHEKSPEESSEDRQPRTVRAVPQPAAPAGPAPVAATGAAPSAAVTADYDDPEFVPNRWQDPAAPEEGDL